MGVLDIIKESITLGIKDFIKNIEKEFSHLFMRRIYQIKKQIMRELMAVFIIIISVGFLAISGVFFLIEYIHLNKTLSFLIIGIIVLFIGILIKIAN